MSRSRKKTPISGWAVSRSCSDYKEERAGRERANERNLLREAMKGDEKAAEKLEVERVPWDEWSCPRDGKVWFGNDPFFTQWRKKLMRK